MQNALETHDDTTTVYHTFFEKGHGRREVRRTLIWPLDDPAQVGFCGARTLVLTLRQFEYIAGPKKGQRSKVEAVYHVSSVPIDEGHGVEYFADAVRRQWAIESKYHARRDWAYCEDVRTRRCNENVTGAMLLARSPVFVFLALSGMENCQAFKEELQSDRNRVFRLVTGGTGA